METSDTSYSLVKESYRILASLCKRSSSLSLPESVAENQNAVTFHSTTDSIYFPIPFKETETLAALKAIEGLVAAEIADIRYGKTAQRRRPVSISLEAATYFGCQAYMAKIGGLGKLDSGVRAKLKDTDLLAAQSNGYRRMSANLYRTKDEKFFHIHGSLEATATLNMIGLEGHRPDLTDYQTIIQTIEEKVSMFTAAELEKLNAERRQAGVTAYKYEEFIQTPHGEINVREPPWTVTPLKGNMPATAFPSPPPGNRKILHGIKVLELCRIIAGPTITRILAEYGADVLKITSPNLSDVPFFQVDGNMGKHAADLDLKTVEGKAAFDRLLADVDVFVDGYRPGALERLGYGPDYLAELAEKRGKGIVYVNENCFGYKGEWAGRPGWQQIADCVTGVAWAQGKFMGLDTPVVPPFPISDYGTGCMGAIAALTGLYHRATRGGSYHCKASLMQYDLLLFAIGQYPAEVQEKLRKELSPEFLALRHHDSVDRISATTLRMLRAKFPDLFIEDSSSSSSSSPYTERWFSERYGEEIEVAKPVAQIEGVDTGFVRASRPNGSDRASWEDFGVTMKDRPLS